MAIWDNYGPEQPVGTGDLFPLGDSLRRGLAVIGALTVVSLALCSTLFLFITFRVIQSRLAACRALKASCIEIPLKNSRKHGRRASTKYTLNKTPTAKSSKAPLSPQMSRTGSTSMHRARRPNDLDVGGADSKDEMLITPSTTTPSAIVPNIRKEYTGYNPLLVLIYMLLIADIIQASSFIPNLVWVSQNGITVRSNSCWGQGWLRSQGDLASGMFAAAISINTYLLVVHQYTMPSRALRLIVATIWSFSFLMVAAGVWSANNGRDHGGYFARVDTWCWISSEYAGTRLWSHFGWVLTTMGIVVLSSLATAISIRRDPTALLRVRFKLRNPRHSGHHPAFLIYPVVYFICCAPMALGPMILLAGVSINVNYFLWAGAMIASNGWLDVLLWSCTMIFLAPKDIKNAGLQDFRFLRSPSVEYGNMVWVEAGHLNETESTPGHLRRAATNCLPTPSMGKQGKGRAETTLSGWRSGLFGGKAASQDREGLIDVERGIKTEIVTSVVVETNPITRDNSISIGRALSTGDAGTGEGGYRYPGRTGPEKVVTAPRRVAHRF